MVSGDIFLRKEFLSRQPILSPIRGERVLYQVTSRPGRSGLGGVIEGWLIHFRCTLVSILDYLTSHFEKALEYNIIGVHRSAISAYHEKVDDMPVGQHPLVTSLMAGIFNSRPPQPMYIFVWNVQVVLNFI